MSDQVLVPIPSLTNVHSIGQATAGDKLTGEKECPNTVPSLYQSSNHAQITAGIPNGVSRKSIASADLNGDYETDAIHSSAVILSEMHPDTKGNKLSEHFQISNGEENFEFSNYEDKINTINQINSKAAENLEHNNFSGQCPLPKPVTKPLLDSAVDSPPNNKHSEEEKQNKKLGEQELAAPDGGYGWLVAFGAFVTQFWVAGLIKSYGVIYVEVLQLFPDSSASLASWIPAVMTTICLVSSPVCSALCQRFSCRSVVFVGGLFSFLGLTLSYFAQNLTQLCFTFGVIPGIGAGLSTTPGIILTSQYFNKRRALANGICVSGTAAGGVILPLLMELLIPLYGFRGCILILGSCMLHVCLSAVVYRPLEIHLHILKIDEKKKLHKTKLKLNEEARSLMEKEKQQCIDHVIGNIQDSLEQSVTEEKDIDESINIPLRLRQRSLLVHSIEDISTNSTCLYQEHKPDINGCTSTTQQKEPSPDKITADNNQQYKILDNKKQSKITDNKERSKILVSLQRYIDITLLKNPIFLLVVVTVMLMAVGCPYALLYLPAYVSSLGFGKTDASLLLSISAIFDFAGRLVSGWVADLNLFSNSRAYGFCMLLTGISVLCLPFATSFASFAVCVSCYGFGLGSWFLLIPVVLCENHGTQSIGSSYGLVRLFHGFVALSVPPFVGFVKDTTGDYIAGFYFMGTCITIGAGLIHLDGCIKRYVKAKDDKILSMQMNPV